MMDTNRFPSFLKSLLYSIWDFVDIPGRIFGKWYLYEYYTEPDKNVQHFTEETLKEKGQYCIIEFSPDKTFNFHTNLSISLFRNNRLNRWSKQKNFLTLIQSENSSENVEFQFAVDRKMLKMLKKDNLGRILFFGFFRKSETKI